MRYDGELVEPLDQKHGVIQCKGQYRFGSDAIALARFAAERARATDRVFDICSGSGIIGIIMAIERDCAVDGAELDIRQWDMSVRSAALNELNNVSFKNADIRNIWQAFPAQAYDIAVCNPPYYKQDGIARKVSPNAVCELTVRLEDVLGCAAYLLKPCGELYMLHISSRLDEALAGCRAMSLTPKTLIVNPNGKTFMLRAVKCGRSGMTLKVKAF